MRPADLPVITLDAATAARVRAGRLARFAPIVEEINGRTVIMQGLSPRMSGDMGSVFMTHDGSWWRVETRLETFEKRRRRDRAQEAFLRMAAPARD